MEMKSKKARVAETTSFEEENWQPSDGELLYYKHATVPIMKKLSRQCLEEVIETNFALQLCDLLSKAQEKHDDCVLGCKDCHARDCQILHDMQNLRIKKPVETLKKVIFKTLCTHNEDDLDTKQHKVESLLMSEPEENHEKPTEYLNFLIDGLESLVCLFDPLDIFFYEVDLEEDYKKNLETLKKFILYRGKYEAGKLFGVMFNIGIKRGDFLPAEKEDVINLMLEAMPYILKFIYIYISEQHSCLDLVRCQKRSALQFVKELLSNSDESVISIELIHAVEEAIEFLDALSAEVDVIKSDYFEDISDEDESGNAYFITTTKSDDFEEISDEAYFIKTKRLEEIKEGFYDLYLDCETLEDFDEAGGNDVPKEHTWWEAFKKAHIK